MSGTLKRREVGGLVAAGALGALLGGAALGTRKLPRAGLPVVLGPASALAGSLPQVFPRAGVVVVRVEGGVAMVSTRCTHLGCTLRLVGEELVCPCHGGRFALHGAVRAGPPNTPLVWVQGGVDPQGRLWCDPSSENCDRSPVDV